MPRLWRKLWKGNHTRKVLQCVNLKPGSVSIANVYHDDWCAIFKGRDCNCNPDVRVTQDDRA